MGEYADMAVDAAMGMGYDPDTYDDTYTQQRSRSYKLRRINGKTCELCKTTGLRWGIDQKTDSWVLEDRDGTRHVCKMKAKLNSVRL